MIIEDGSVNWNWMMQAGAALATYIALVGAFLVGMSPLEFALFCAVVLCLWLSWYSIFSRMPQEHRTDQLAKSLTPSLAESMAELHSLQSEINTMQAQFAACTGNLLGRIIGVFVEQTPKGVEAICTACSSGDLETVRTSAHAIKSSAAYVGAAQFSTRMANIEGAARDNDLPKCQELIDGLNDHSQLVIDELLALQDKAA